MQTRSVNDGVERAPLFYSSRPFRLWRYGVGHSQLLLRSLPVDGEPCLDVLFEGVRWIQMPTSLHSLTIELTGQDAGHAPPPTSQAGGKTLTLRLSAANDSGTIECSKVSAYTSSWTVSSVEEPNIIETLFIAPADLDS